MTDSYGAEKGFQANRGDGKTTQITLKNDFSSINCSNIIEAKCQANDFWNECTKDFLNDKYSQSGCVFSCF